MRRLARALFPFVIFGVLFAGAFGLQHEIIRLESESPQRYYDLLYLPSSRYVQLASVGYEHFTADFFFLRVIQVFGATFAREVDLGQLWAYFDVITDLDPHYLPVYSFGNMVMGEEHGDRVRGLAILDKGIENNPQTYRLAFEAAFYCLWGINEPDEARRYIQMAKEAPDTPDFVRRWEGFIDEQMGRYRAAFQQFLGEYIRALNANERTLIAVNDSRLRTAIDQWYKAELLEKVLAHHEAHGVYPSVGELEAAGAFLEVEWPDWRALNAYLDEVVESGQTIDETEEAIERLTERFVHANWGKMPPNPSDHPVFRGYLIWPGQEPLTGTGRENPLFVGSELNIAIAVRQEMIRAAMRIQAYKERNDGACPRELETVSPTLARLEEPWGGRWVIEPIFCYVYPSTHPEIGKQLVGWRRL